MRTTKQYRLDTLRQWVTKLLRSEAGEFYLGKLKRSDNDTSALFDFEASLTSQQLKAVNALMAAAYSAGCNETRNYWSPKFHGQKKLAQKVG